MADRLYTSNEADEVLSALRFETKLEKATLARSPEKTEEFVKFTAEAFYKNY